MKQTIKTQHLDKVIQDYAQDMTGKVVAITGTTSGTGYVCAREVAGKGAAVILLNRKSERAGNALENLRREAPEGSFDWIECDLQRLESVRKALEAIKSKYEVVDVLVNNAGVMALEDTPTPDGFDIQMQTNVISHFLITKELFPLLRKSNQARIVNHTSMARLGGPLELQYFEKKGGNLGGDGTEEENSNFRGPRWERYHQTKLANAVFTYALKKDLEEAKIADIIPLLAHPGLAATNLQTTTAAHGGMNGDSDLMNRAQSAEDGATGIIRAAMDPKAKAGDFYGPTEGWKGFPEKQTPEESLYDEQNIEVFRNGCEKAVGEFKI